MPDEYHLSKIPPRPMMPGGQVRLIHAQTMTLAYWEFEADTPLPEHSHPHEQVFNLLEGRCDSGECAAFGESGYGLPGAGCFSSGTGRFKVLKNRFPDSYSRKPAGVYYTPVMRFLYSCRASSRR